MATDKLAAEMLDRFERAAMAYERLGKLTKDDEKTRDLRRVAIAELAEARRALLEERSAREAALAAANDIDVKTVVQELNVEDHREYNRIITALEAENKRLREALELFAAFGETADKVADLYGENEFIVSFGPVPVGVILLDAIRRARDLSRNRRETP